MILKIKSKIKSYIRYAIYRVKFYFQERSNVIILDDIFPHLLSGFRIAEFNVYLENIDKCKVFSTSSAFQAVHESRSFEEVKNEYSKLYPSNNKKIIEYTGQDIKANLVYAVFLNNIYNFLQQITLYKTPFIFTLYPGGGFRLNQKESDRMLKEVFASPYFRKVIVTTKTTFDYLLNNNFCDKGKIEFIYGVVSQSNVFKIHDFEKKKMLADKSKLDICFVAHKYTHQGKDKGYDIFIKVAKILSKIHKNIFFHVVGTFDESDIDVSDIKNNIIFYKTLKTHEFSKFYQNVDIILSPNSSFILAPGAFDGFPTGACIEAGLNGVALFVSDDLKQNFVFKEDEEIVIISLDPNEIVDKVLYYYNNPERLYSLSEKGKLQIQSIYNLESQMNPRIDIINKAIS